MKKSLSAYIYALDQESKWIRKDFGFYALQFPEIKKKF